VATTGDHGTALRLAAMAYLDRLHEKGRETVTWEELVRGFEFQGETISLVGQRGIHRLQRLGPVPLSITTAPERPGRERPYDDSLGSDGFIRYRYFQTDPEHPDNRGLRRAWRERVPLIYFYGVEVGVYAPFYPVLVVADDPASLSVTVQVEERARFSLVPMVHEDSPALREYVTRAVKRRVHQLLFSRRVVRAYRGRCAMCQFRHVLDGAHILPDTHPRGDPVVPNGLALCKLHHAAFDGNLLGVDPDHRIHVRAEILDEEDGPVLQHGIQRLDGAAIALPLRPESRPDRARLEERFAMFKSAG
jgi:putative restriction endonuclease